MSTNLCSTELAVLAMVRSNDLSAWCQMPNAAHAKQNRTPRYRYSTLASFECAVLLLVLNAKRMGFGIGKEIGRERDGAREGWKVDFGAVKQNS